MQEYLLVSPSYHRLSAETASSPNVSDTVSDVEDVAVCSVRGAWRRGNVCVYSCGIRITYKNITSCWSLRLYEKMEMVKLIK